MLVSEAQDVLGAALTGALEKRGFTSLTQVQAAVLAPDLEGRDLRISSKTGSGKTVAIGFVVRSLVEAQPPAPRALVITPTRELAKQVADELSWLFEPLGATVAALTGGASYRNERRALDLKPAVVVGTPGRLLDYLRRGNLDAKGLGAIVLDEADRMLDLGFREDIEAIFSFAPGARRTHLVSATFSKEVRALADRVQTNSTHVEGTPLGAANEDIAHVIHLISATQKLDAIVNLLLATPGSQTVIFARTRADVAELYSTLRDNGFVVGMLSGEMDQPERNRALADFKRGHLDALVATDVAARGIDVQDIGRVIHAEPPGDVDAYTHRSGRTGRAGRKGTSSVLATPATLSKTERLLERAKVAFRIEPIPSAEQIRALRDERVIDLLTREPDAEDSTGEPNAHLVELAERIAKSDNVTRAIARLLDRARAGGPSAPREVATIAVPARKGARPRSEETESAGDGAPRGRREGPRPEHGDFDLFRVAWGQAHGADARRLLAMVCRRGGIQSRDIGAIRVARTYSVVEVSKSVAEQFARATRDPDPRDPRATIRRAEEGTEARPQPAPRPERPAPRAERPAPRAERPAPRAARPAPYEERPAPRAERPATRPTR
ncbi:MAG: DEAD/DEAH box helicase, partial [Polyangiaceae bacterium]|nr:DEAD/DEAH box helicase [Polyangiaceae bacterium]